MRWLYVAAFALGGACGAPAEVCDPLDPDSCALDEICHFGPSGAHCGSEGRLGVALPKPLEPCSGAMPCPSGFICLAYGCNDGALGYAGPSRDIRDNGCLPLCDNPAEYDPGVVGSQCVAFDPIVAAEDYGLDLTSELVAAACSQ